MINKGLYDKAFTKIIQYKKQARRWQRTYTRHLQRLERSVRACYHRSTTVARISELLGTKKKYIRPTHDLLCNCRKCIPSHRKFVAAVTENKPWH